MSMTESMVEMDIASATRDATQGLPMISTPMAPSGSFLNTLIAQIQALFAQLEMLLTDLEGTANMRLSQLESSILSNPNLNAAQKQQVANRLDMSQMKVDQRFNMARSALMGADTRTIAGLERARGMGGGGMVDLGGGDMVPATAVTRDLFGRMVTIPKHSPMVPPGLAKKIPPGIPPGQARRLFDMSSGLPHPPGRTQLLPNFMNLRFNK